MNSLPMFLPLLNRGLELRSGVVVFVGGGAVLLKRQIERIVRKVFAAQQAPQEVSLEKQTDLNQDNPLHGTDRDAIFRTVAILKSNSNEIPLFIPGASTEAIC